MSYEQGSGLMPPAVLTLPARAESVREARRFLRELLRSVDRERWSDAAELALSEVVTNGVLHAHTELTLRVRAYAELLEVEVSDGNPSLPTQRRTHAAEATTGRGLELVAALTLDCGVRPDQTGKVVWFTVGDAGTEEAGEDELLAAWDDDTWGAEAWGGDAWERAPLPDLHRVVLERMPTSLWMVAREHHQALLRELVLYAAEHEDVAPSLPDLALADQARHLIWTGLLAEIDDSTASGDAPPDAVDLPLLVPAELGPAFGALQDALDVGERLAATDRLLVRPALPEVVAVRDWACEQVVAQLAGVPAAPWPGTDSAHFEDVHGRHVDVPAAWDSTPVVAAERGVVAADEANRILAISPPLARLLGWEPEELVGRRVVALVPPELREQHVVGFSRHLTTGEATVLGAQLELPVLRRDGTTLLCSFRVERAVLEAGTAGRSRAVYLAEIEPLEGEPLGG